MSRILIPVPLRWGDLDAYGHVNNVAVLQLLEEARIAAFWRHPEAAADESSVPSAVLDAGPGAGTHTLVARQEIEYLLPIDYRRQPLTVEIWLGRLGGASLDVCYQITDALGGRGAAVPGGDVTVGGDVAAVVAAVDALGPRSVFVQASTTIVLIDAATSRPRRITTAERAIWEQLLDEPVTMRRRRADDTA